MATVDSTTSRALDSSRGRGQCACVRTVTVALASLLAATAAPRVTRADLGLDVRAQATVSVDLEVTDAGTRVLVRLSDDLGAPIAQGRVDVALDATPRECASSLRLVARRDGTAQALVPRACTVRGAFARFEGDALHEAHESTVRTLEARPRVDVRLAVERPERIDLARATVRVHVVATPMARAGGKRLEILDELARVLAEGTLDPSGERVLDVPTRSLGGPGPGTFVARVLDDVDGVEIGRAEVPVARFRAVRVSLEARARPQDIELAGDVRDAAGAVGGATVSLIAGDDTALASAITDVNGRFAVRVDASRWPRGAETVEARARYVADRPGREDTDSRAVTLVPPGTRPKDLLRYALPIAAAAVALLLARRRREVERVPPLAAKKTPPVIELASRTSIAPWGARDRTLALTVLDRDDEQPIAHALVVVHGAHGPSHATTDREGRARFDALPDGDLRVEVDAQDYATTTFPMHSPHRGEWSDARVRLESFRAQARRALLPVAERVLVPPTTFDDVTLREVADASSAHGGVDAGLVAEIETAAYGPVPPTLEEVARFENGVRTFTEGFDVGRRPPLR